MTNPTDYGATTYNSPTLYLISPTNHTRSTTTTHHIMSHHSEYHILYS